MISYKYQISILVLIMFQTNMLLAQMNHDNFDHISVKEGLSQSVVNCIFQDSKGFMWFGTQDGLNMYDGNEFTVFQASDKENAISGNYILCIDEDKNGNIWIGTEGNGLNRYNRKYGTFKHFLQTKGDELPPAGNSIMAISGDSSGNLWIGTDKGLNKLNLSIDTTNNKLNTSGYLNISGITKANDITSVTAILSEDNGHVWVGTETGLFRFTPGNEKPDHFKHTADNLKTLSHNHVLCLYKDHSGDIWIGTNRGVNKFDKEKKAVKRITHRTSFGNILGDAEIMDMTEDNKGNLWFATFGSGLIRYNSKYEIVDLFKHAPDNAESLSNDYLLSLYTDHSGLLWIGTYGGGLNTLDPVKIQFGKIQKNGDVKNTLPSNEIFAICEKDKTVWLGTDSGLCRINALEGRIETIEHIESPNSLSHNIIYALLIDSHDNLWIGTAGGGLNKLSAENIRKNNYEFEVFSSLPEDSSSLLSNEIMTIFEDRDTNLWVGTSKGLYKIDTTGRVLESFISQPEKDNTLIHNEVYCIRQNKAGNLLIGTFDGFNYFNPEKKIFSHMKDEHLFSSEYANTIYSVHEDRKGGTWLGTDNAGLIYIDKGNSVSKVFTTDNGLPDNVIYGILEDDDGNLWLSTNNGLSKVVAGNDMANISFINYHEDNWLHCNSFNIGAFHKNTDGILFFGCDEGVVFFDPDDIRVNEFVPPVVMTDFQLFFQPVKIGPGAKSPLSQHITETEKIVLNHRQNVLKFKFAALSYIQSEKNNYAYKMEGLDQDWIYVKNNPEAIYTYVPPGDYTFKVKASNNDGIWNDEGTAVDIIVKPPFYKTVWFYMLIGILILGLTVLIIHIRTRNLKKMKKFLEHKVAERTKEVLMQKEELEVALENLKSTQNQLIESEKMASLGQLTAGVAHEINNPINFVSANIKPLKRDIEDIIKILFEYERIVKQKSLEKNFIEINKLKESLDYVFLLEEIDNLLKGIGEGAVRTAEIVRGLRNFSRLDENELKLADINEGLESTLLILKNKFKNRIQIRKTFSDIPQIYCYPGKLNQVFMNILNNAMQAIPETGIIEIKTYSENGEVAVSIRDNGVGMPGEVKKRIFEPFYTTKEVGRGTGLGLSISYGIIEKHHGTISVHSKEGEGTEFIIRLPATLKKPV
jgi:ligand-binding sensor domain-containing protein/signal transduction histidine kinase